jgi:hypothetical protein
MHDNVQERCTLSSTILQPHPHQQIIQRRPCGLLRHLAQRAGIVGGLEFGTKTLIFTEEGQAEDRAISSPSITRLSSTVSSRSSSPKTFGNGSTCAPRKSKSESGEGNPYKCAPLIVANSRGYG